MELFKVSALMICLVLSQLVSAGQYDYIYPARESKEDHRFDYLIRLLDESLQATERKYGAFSLQPAAHAMTESRYLLEVKEGKLLNLVWSSTSIEKENTLRAIRVPLLKGLLGYRIALINADNQEKISQSLGSIDNLKDLSIGQGRGWGDVILYRHNGFRVLEDQYDNLFKLAAASRFDLFPRGVNEVFTEYEFRVIEEPSLAVEQDLLIHYPWPYYFFTARSSEHLASRLEEGLKELINSGRFQQLFEEEHGPLIERSNLRQRKMFRIENPVLPENTPLNDKSLWYNPLAP